MHSERDLDEAIDRAVRDIMSAEPRAGLRGRVLDQLVRREPWITVPRLATAAALLVVALTALFVSQREPAPVEEPSLAIQQPQAPAPAAVPPSRPQREPARSEPKQTASGPAAPPAFPRPQRGITAANVPETTVFGPRGVVMVEVDGVPVPSLVVEPIRLESLEIPRIQISPVVPPR